MPQHYWEVKRNAFGVVCITMDFHGTVTIWGSLEQARQDVEERIEDFLSTEGNCFKAIKVDDGYEIREKHSDRIVRCYKIFDAQELE